MFRKEKVLKIDVVSKSGVRLLSTSQFEIPKSFASKGALLILKGRDFPEIPQGEEIGVIFYMTNSDRLRFDTKVSISTQRQLNALINGNPKLLEDRRRYYKVYTDIEAQVSFFCRGGQTTTFEQPLGIVVKDINIGGVFIRTNYDFSVGDELMLILDVGGKKLEISADILRKQDNEDATCGYGCRFLNTTLAQEQTLAQFIFSAQLANRYK